MIGKGIERKLRVGVVGGGSWATALVKILTDNNNRVRWWLRNEESIKYIREHSRNPKYLSSLELNLRKARLYDSIKKVVRNSDILVVAVPSAFVKEVFENVTPRLLKSKIIICSIKGMIPEDNLIMADYFKIRFSFSENQYMVIGGPCHAEEVAQEKLSFLTIAGKGVEDTQEIAKLFENRYVNTTLSQDVHGIEYAEVLKNIIAIASGIARGCGYGDNFQAVLISNAVREVKRFVQEVCGNNRDIDQSVYLGDILVTAYSQYSRNRTFGNMIGMGYSVKSAQLEMRMIAEGYYAAKCIKEINDQYKVDMPIMQAVYNVLYEKIAPALEMKLLAEKLT